MVNLDEVLTFSEAAEKWGLADGKSIRKAVERQKFESHEIKRSGNVWLTTYDAMYRVFGEPRITSTTFYMFDFYNVGEDPTVLKRFLKDAEAIFKRGGTVTIVESHAHPERIICILKSKEEMEGWERRFQYFLQSK